MKVVGDYKTDGYAWVRDLISVETAQALMATLKADLGPGAIPLSRQTNFPNLLQRPAFEIYGYQYAPMLAFLWGLTPLMCELTGKDLLPTYDYLRIYREGDTCRVHFDRPSCEHSLSLTLDYSDGEQWPLEVGAIAHSKPNSAVEEGFGDEPFTSVPMAIGDAVLYRGTNHRHGRISGNPNAWSAHLFLHWVDRNGPHASHAFDGRVPERVNFAFA